LDNTGIDFPVVQVNLAWIAYQSENGGPCQPSLTGGGAAWSYRLNCKSGIGTYLPNFGGLNGGELGIVQGKTGYYPCGAPSVYVELVDL